MSTQNPFPIRHKIAEALAVEAAPGRPDFEVLVNTAALLVPGAQHVAGRIKDTFGAAVRHTPAPGGFGGFDRFAFAAASAGQRPVHMQAALAVTLRAINEAFTKISPCMEGPRCAGCHDPIDPAQAIPRAVAAFAPESGPGPA